MRTATITLVILAAASISGVEVGLQDYRLPAEDVIIRAPLEDAFVIGRETGADHELLFGLVDIAFAPDGELYVLEERNHRVLVYGPDGEFRRQFGGRGQGPGEFELPTTLAITAGDEVAVWDFTHRAYLLFDRAGEYLRNVGWGDWSSGPRRNTLRALPSGGVAYLLRALHEPGDPAEEINRGTVMYEPLGDAGGAEELLDVHLPKRRGQRIGGVLRLNNGARFAAEAHWDVLADGRVAVADEPAYSVRLVDPETGTTDFVTRAIEPRPVTQSDRERELTKQRESLERPAGGVSFSRGPSESGGPPAMDETRIQAILDAMEFADVIPVIRDLRVDGAGRLWIQRRGATFDAPGPIDIVTADGDYLGTLPPMIMPDDFGPDGLVAWMERGREVDVERVIVRRLPAELR